MCNRISWKDIWGDNKMYASLYKKRPMYTNNEIVNLVNSKIEQDNLIEENIAKKFNTDINTIKYMREKKYRYSYKMLKIASEFLSIEYDDLTGILIDDEEFSPRADTEQDTEEFFGFLNYIFNEMIKQNRLSK